MYLWEGRLFSGFYVVHLCAALSPLFLRRMSGDGWQGLVVPILVAVAVVVGVILSAFGLVSWNVDKWIPPLLTVLLVVMMGRVMWVRTGGAVRYEAVAASRDWLSSFADALYYAILVLIAFVGLCLGEAESWRVVVGTMVSVALLVGLVVALWVRMRSGRAFLFFPSREEAYLGLVGRSSRVAYANEECGLSGEELFNRLKEYFDERMPYLNPKANLTDVAKALLTNKVYLSRAINEFTGQNFCQFVNFYRVRYAMNLFCNNNSYKVTALAAKSGFHSEKSFTMAFRLYMNMSPSRWCKLNRGKTIDQALRN
ncbi:MAG: AraC family transcriptional regulator [Bacteroidales bacterium]|nr:AraC family transcriptional regulator [Bacteroidales bacterium]